MKKLIAFCGESASGKDTVANLLVDQHPKEFQRKISYTTRKRRPHEIDGEDYHFISDQDFFNMVAEERMIEATEFNKEMYGTGIDSLSEDKINVGVFDPDGIEILLNDRSIDLVTIYIKTDERIRLKRCIDRDTHLSIDEIYDRYKLDRRLFDGIENFPDILILENKGDNIDFNVRIIKMIADGIFSE